MSAMSASTSAGFGPTGAEADRAVRPVHPRPVGEAVFFPRALPAARPGLSGTAGSWGSRRAGASPFFSKAARRRSARATSRSPVRS